MQIRNGVADELEQNGFQNFDLGRAAQNATVGAASGAVTGALNKGISGRLAKNGGNLFKGGNAVTRGLNDLGSKTALGRAVSTVGSGAARGALSGAVGGATGAGVSSALQGADIGTGLANAAQGAVQGAKSGALTGATMAGANLAFDTALSKATPDFYKSLKENQARNAAYGDTLREQFKGAWNSGDSGTAEFLKTVPERLSNGIDAVKNYIGSEREGFVANPLNMDAMDESASGAERVTNAFNKSANQKVLAKRGDTEFSLGDFGRDNLQRKFDGMHNLSESDIMNVLNTSDKQSRAGDSSFRKDNIAWFGELPDGTRATVITRENALGQQEIINAYKNNPGYEAELINKYGTPAQSRTGSQDLEDLGVKSVTQGRNSIIPQNEQNVNITEENNPDLMYGESALGNRTRRGMVADSLERFGDSLEGAQTNVTRAAAKDLGIESTGKSIDNVRKKTGIVNLETQAALAKELTGGENSLMDSVQRMALGYGEDGKPYSVDTDSVTREVSAIVDKYADTNMFGSQNARDKFVRNLKSDISASGSDILSIANRMKSNAADLRGRGVVSPKPADAAKAKIYTEIANKLEDLSYKAIPQDNVDAMFDATVSEMRGRATQAANNGNKDIAKAYNTLADSLDAEPRTIRAYRSFKKDFVDVSKINDLTAAAENGAAVQMGRSFGGSLKRFGNTLLQRPVNTALAKIGGAVNSLADKINAGGTTPPVATTTTATPEVTSYNPSEGLSNGEQARTANYLVDAVQGTPTTGATTLEGLVSPTTTGSTSVYDSVYGSPTTQAASTQGSYFQPTGDYWTDILGKAMSAAIDADDVTAFASLYGMYQDALNNLQKSNSSSSTQKLSTTQQRANAAMNSLERLSQMTPDLAYNLSNIPLLGNIATLGGNDYESEAKSLAQQIGYMVSGSNIKDSEAEAIGKSYVPQPWDNEQVRQNKLRRAYEIISQYQNSYAE